jgi:hypothetical protein
MIKNILNWNDEYKGHVVPAHATMAGGVEILLNTISTSELNGPGSQLYSPAASSPGTDPLYPLDKMLIAPKDSLGWK